MSTPPPIHPPPPPMPPPQAGGVPVPNYMVWAIIVAILGLCFCCGVGAIPGIVGIVFAAKVNGALDRGDFAEAQRSSDAAKLWCWIGTGLVILGVLLSIVSFATGGMAGYMETLQQMQAARGR
ncbi:CD225/dispanin family protein [Cognatilysobacter segetis]|uniref:CD225/dispanin family protein n=1 Tax=Cognatilysobacter segetis TaxID=2492394 RepID=UPI00105DB874|nr:CD225/dispanin family protein [Lysobacter segetis]